MSASLRGRVSLWLASMACMACGAGSASSDMNGADPDPRASAEPPEAEAPSVALHELAPLAGDGAGRVAFFELRLGAGARYAPRTSACQDTLALVRDGQVAASGPGIGTEDEPALLGPGDAARFGQGEGNGLSAGQDGARLLLALTRARAAPRGAAEDPNDDPPDDPACLAELPPMGGECLGVTRAADTPVLRVAGGTLRVTILLDATRCAHFGGLSILDADPDAAMPTHTHDDEVEALVVDEADGAMPLGETEVPVRGGSVIMVPPGAVHSFHPSGTRPLRAVQVYAPSGPEQRFRRMAAPPGDGPSGG